jgi:hypothetical protein
MSRWIYLLAIVFCLPLFADENPPDNNPQSTPKDALTYFLQVGTDPSLDRATIFYYATTPDQKKVATAFASVDLATAKLRKLAKAHWDAKAGDTIVHALRDITEDDVDAADVKIKGDKATVTGKGFDSPLPMQQTDGKWRISIPAVLDESQASADDLSAACRDLVDVIERTQEEVQADKYANPSLLDRAIKRRVKAILGDR